MENIFMKWGEALSDLENAIFSETSDNVIKSAVSASNEIEGQVTLGEAYQPVYDENDQEEQVETPEDMIRESMTAVERMKQEIAAENIDLDRRFAENDRRKINIQPVRKRRPVYVIGVLSSAASLIFMGAAMTIAVSSSPIGIYSAIKLSPIMLIFIGIDIIFAALRSRSLRIKIDIRSVILITALTALSAVLAIVSVTASSGNGERVYAEQRIQNMLANDLHDTIAKDYIRSVDIETQLFGENAEMYETPADLTEGDIINLKIYFSDAQMPIREFARDCREILGDLKRLSYNFGSIMFIADDKENHYTLDIDWHYQSDYSADRLAALVNYFGDDISDSDIRDITDDGTEN